MKEFKTYYENCNINTVRLCANCEQEFGKIPREPDKNYTHGYCRRHWIMFLKDLAKAGSKDAVIELRKALKSPDTDFSPDMAKK